jgi:putative transposase
VVAGYVAMPEHIHLLIAEPERSDPSTVMHDFNVWSARKQGEKLCYIHRNPVTRGLVSAPELWAWSSFRWYAYAEAGVVRDWPTAAKHVGTSSVVAHPSKPAKGGAPTLE